MAPNATTLFTFSTPLHSRQISKFIPLCYKAVTRVASNRVTLARQRSPSDHFYRCFYFMDQEIYGLIFITPNLTTTSFTPFPSTPQVSSSSAAVQGVLERSGLSLKDNLPGSFILFGEALMAPTVIYVKRVIDIISKGGVKGIAHITDGGFTDNIPRVFPQGLGAAINKDSWVVPHVFKWIQEAGEIEDVEMRRTFNMGIGMVLVVDQEAALRILEAEHGANKAFRIGEAIQSDRVSFK